MESLPQQIKALRKSHGLSQKELAEKAGLSRVSIGQIELGNAMPSIPNLTKIVNALECDISIHIHSKRLKR